MQPPKMSRLSSTILTSSTVNQLIPRLLHLSPSLRHTFSRRLPPLPQITFPSQNQRRHLTIPPGALPDYRIARKYLETSLAEASRFPWKDEFELGHDVILDADTVINTLGPFMTEDRLARIEKVCSNRTFDVLPIVEHPYDLGNLAAVFRSADALGCGAVHVIRNVEDDRYKQSARTSGGAEKWLDVQIHKSTTECLNQAKQLGYQVVATHLRADAVSPAEIDWTKPTAIVFGNELKGVTDEALQAADACIAIPMDGFVESFNISVAAALILWEARRVRQERLGANGNLSLEQIKILKAVMVLRTRGLAKTWVSHLLRKPPPEWQQYRNKGNWQGKEFEGGAEAIIPPSQRKKCYFWDGECCWGEKLIFPGKVCRYAGAHNKSISTINAMKLEEACERVGAVMPELQALKNKLKKGGERSGEGISEQILVELPEQVEEEATGILV